MIHGGVAGSESKIYRVGIKRNETIIHGQGEASRTCDLIRPYWQISKRMENEKQKFFLTFGYGSPFRNKYVEMEAEDAKDAIQRMFSRFGSSWAMIYTPEEFAGQIEQFGLTKLDVEI